MTTPFAYELGVFDPTFPGVTLHYPNEATWQKSAEVTALLYALGGRDVVDQHRASTGERPTAEELQRIFVANPDLGVNLSPREKDELGREFIASDPDNAVANLAIASTFEHERRHFHDWLLSPYTAAINAMRAEVFVNSRSVRAFLERDGTTVIPVPLQRWLRKPEAEQETLVRRWESLLGDTTPIKLPDLQNPELVAAVESIARRYRSIGILFEPVSGTQLDAAAMFEASALLIQIQAIHDLFGETASNLFATAMTNVSPPSRYGWFLRAMSGLAGAGERLENNVLSTIAVWCLLGNNTADPANAHPLVRLGHAVGCVTARGLAGLDRPTSAILDELDRFSGAMPYRDLLEHSIELGRECAEQTLQIATDERSGSRFVLGIAQTQSALHNCHSEMAALFLEAPELYCEPATYLDHALGRLPEPPWRQTFGRPFHAVSSARLENCTKVTLFEEASTPDRPVVRETIEQLLPDTIDLQAADNWQYLCALADVVFAEHNRDSPEIASQRDRAKADGIRYMEVLI